MWRINALLTSGSNQAQKFDNLEVKRSTIRFGLSFGKEFRKPVSDRLELRYGIDLLYSYNKDKNTQTDLTNTFFETINENYIHQSGVNFVIGFNYLITKNIIIGAELLPGISYFKGTSTEINPSTNETESDLSGLVYGLSNSSALLTLSYRF